jgi:glycosyltransferase involved in cell wall biosynthesis
MAPAGPVRADSGANRAGLRIVIGADTYWPDVNGAARFSQRLASGLAARGHDVHVLCPAPDGKPGREVIAGVTVHRVRAHRTRLHRTFRVCPPWQANVAANALLAELAPDLVHVQAHFVLGRALTHAAGRWGVPLVATNHFMPENLFGYLRVPGRLRPLLGRLAWWDAIRLLARAALVTAPTPRAVQLLRERGLDRPVEAVSCGVDLHHFEVAIRPAPAPPIVLFVGRLDEEKRVDELLRAVAILPADQPVQVDIVGTGTRRAGWQALAGRLCIAGRVTFHGFVPDADLPDVYARCAVFCMPGVAELQSLATMEAMAAGKPVVAADAMALPHLVHHGHNGWLYPPGDVPALAAALSGLLADTDLRTRMGTASRQLIAEHNSDATIARFEALYCRVLAAAAAAAADRTPVENALSAVVGS